MENGEHVLHYDSGVGDEERILVQFGSPQGLQSLSQYDNWYADGTFKVIPEVFYQLYTVHAQCGDRIFPCIFALLPNKTEETYTRLLKENVSRINFNGPGQILVDFECAAINAIITTIPNAVIKGCFYHLCSNVWKHIQRLGHQVRYVEEPEFGLRMRWRFFRRKTLFQDSRNCAMMLEQITKLTSILSILKIPTSGDIGETPQDADRYSQ